MDTNLHMERDQELKALSRQLAEIEGVVSSSSDMLLLVGEAEEVRYANTAFLRAFGLLDTFKAGTQLESLFPGMESWPARISQVLAKVLEGESHESAFWSPVPNLGDQFLYLSVRPFISPTGVITGAVVVLRNQTDHQQRIQSLRLLETAIHQVSESIVITDANGAIEYVNPYFERTTGYSREEALGKSPGILKSGTVPDSFYRDLWSTIQSGRTWSGRFVNRRRNGELFTEDATISPVVDASGRITHFVAVKRDVSSEVALAQQLQLAEQFESRSQVYRNMLHELNNHLAVILGHSELLAEMQREGAPRPASISSITEHARAMSTLIHAAMERDVRREADDAGCDLTVVASRSCDMLARILPESISFRSEIAERALPVAMAAHEADLMVTNLLMHAEDAIVERGDISLRVDLAAWLPESLQHAQYEVSYAMVEVSDSGPGMDAYTRAHLFDQFFTANPESATAGLGLWRVRQLLDTWGGDVDVESAPGQGTRMTIWIPLRADALVQDEPAPLRSLSDLSVVVIDDDPAYLRLTTAMLTIEDVHVQSFDDPIRGLAWLRTQSEPPDLLLADKRMPTMDGWALVAAARDIHPDLVVVLLSGQSDESGEPVDDGHRPVLLLRKPFEASELHHVLMRVRSRQRQENHEP